MEKLNETISYLNSKLNDFKPEIGIILGSGLSYLVQNVEGIKISYKDIPNFACSNVLGHKGEFLFCEIENKKCAIMQGRFHYYEGHSIQMCAYPIEVFKSLGVKTLFVTNAVGATNLKFNVGDIFMVNDHINFMGANPLIARDDSKYEKFPDMSNCYTKSLQILAHKCAKELNLDLKEGVYLATTGPNYETKAEVRAFKALGADVIGMSNVPEIIMANYLKIDAITLALITNYATGVSDKTLSHQEVIEIGQKSGKNLANLIKKMLKNL